MLSSRYEVRESNVKVTVFFLSLLWVKAFKREKTEKGKEQEKDREGRK